MEMSESHNQSAKVAKKNENCFEFPFFCCVECFGMGWRSLPLPTHEGHAPTIFQSSVTDHQYPIIDHRSMVVSADHAADMEGEREPIGSEKDQGDSEPDPYSHSGGDRVGEEDHCKHHSRDEHDDHKQHPEWAIAREKGCLADGINCGDENPYTYNIDKGLYKHCLRQTEHPDSCHEFKESKSETPAPSGVSL